MKVKTTMLSVVLLVLGWVTSAYTDELVSYARDPASLIAEVARRGAIRVVAELSEKGSWASVVG